MCSVLWSPLTWLLTPPLRGHFGHNVGEPGHNLARGEITKDGVEYGRRVIYLKWSTLSWDLWSLTLRGEHWPVDGQVAINKFQTPGSSHFSQKRINVATSECATYFFMNGGFSSRLKPVSGPARMFVIVSWILSGPGTTVKLSGMSF